MYHTVCSRRIDKDYTSYIPYSRYIGMCVCVCRVCLCEYLRVFFSGCIEVTVYTIRDHSSYCWESSINVSCVEQWAVSLQGGRRLVLVSVS